MHWTQANVSYVVDPSLEKNVAGASDAATSAVAGWSGAAGGPRLSATVGTGGAHPGVDGQNSILFAPHGFAPAGGALAVTVTSYEDSTGEIVDADIVVNGLYGFAVLASGTRPGPNVSAVSTDGSSGDDDGASHETPFDIVHVLSHEVGHSLGLADERTDNTALMYAFTMPGDPSLRVPSSDDVDGVDAIYGSSADSTLAPSGQTGCSQASVAGSRARPSDVWAAFAIVGGAAAWLAARRRVKAARVVLPLGVAVAALVVGASPARSAPLPTAILSDASARVVGISTTNVDGLFQTTLELEPTACRSSTCPARAYAHVWGGSVGGITQQVGSGSPSPVLGDSVDITFPRAIIAVGGQIADTAAPMAVIVAPHH